MEQGNLRYHIMAIVVSIIWGTTFVSTKILINNGLSPAEIMFYRFAIAYVLTWFFSPKRLFSDSLKDELMLAGSGIFGGTLYFLTENQALTITLASNVSLIICTAPLLTAILLHLTVKGERLRKNLWVGSLVALAGVALVVFNGNFILKISPLGDALTLAAAFSWAVYTIIIKRLEGRYSTIFITRKVFFYGLLTLAPVFLFRPLRFDPAVMLTPAVGGNLLFLGVIASMLCFMVWNVALKKLGGIRTSNYIFLNPVATLVTSSIVLNEPVTPIAVAGAGMILFGVYVSEKPGVLRFLSRR